MNFEKFENKHFDELDNITLKIFKDYCYPHGVCIELNFGLNKTCSIIMLEVVVAK